MKQRDHVKNDSKGSSVNLKFGHTPNYTYNRSYEVYFQKSNLE